MISRGTRFLAVLAVSALALSACSDDGEPTAGDASDSASASEDSGTSATPDLAVPAGVELTDQGSDLAVGDTATVAWEPDKNTVGALDITVQKLEQTTLKDFSAFKLDAATKKSTPFYVRAAVENVGDTDLGGTPVPLYVVDGKNTLIQASTFTSSFKKCPSMPFPTKFAKGAKASVCLVYLVPNQGTLEAVSFRPTQEFDPITWAGTVTKPAPAKKAKPKKKA